MPIPLLALVGFSVWTALIMLLGVGIHRWSQILLGGARLSQFPGDVPHGSEAYRRIVRAHANCVENLPVFGAIVLAASATGFASRAFDTLSLAVLAARIVQSTIHMSSGSDRAIAFRFTFFAFQLCAFLVMAALLLVPLATAGTGGTHVAGLG